MYPGGPLTPPALRVHEKGAEAAAWTSVLTVLFVVVLLAQDAAGPVEQPGHFHEGRYDPPLPGSAGLIVISTALLIARTRSPPSVGRAMKATRTVCLPG